MRNTKNYMDLPYNPKLKERARNLRKARNLPEVLFWNRVKKHQFMDLDFDRQKIIGNYIADFYCSTQNVVIEIDGPIHKDRVEYDRERDLFMESLGLKIIRIPSEQILFHLDQVMISLQEHHFLK
jgi:very-short-patch-repair endonuclease